MMSIFAAEDAEASHGEEKFEEVSAGNSLDAREKALEEIRKRVFDVSGSGKQAKWRARRVGRMRESKGRQRLLAVG